jgi:guanine nucleotide-binding protein subunit alpha
LWSPSILDDERLYWRTVIFLNLVVSIRRVLDCLSVRPQTDNDRPGTGSSSHSVEDTYARYAGLKLKLSPMLQLEHVLLNILGAPAEFDAPTRYDPNFSEGSTRKRDILVQLAWQERLAKSRSGRGSRGPGYVDRAPDPGDAAAIISACRPELLKLWDDPFVHAVIAKRKLRLEESSGLYVSSLHMAHA